MDFRVDVVGGYPFLAVHIDPNPSKKFIRELEVKLAKLEPGSYYVVVQSDNLPLQKFAAKRGVIFFKTVKNLSIGVLDVQSHSISY
jgi:hypothetical protein